MCVYVLECMCCSLKASLQAKGRAMFQAKGWAKAKEKGSSQKGSCILDGSRCSYISCMCFSLVFIMHVCVYLCLHCEVQRSQT